MIVQINDITRAYGAEGSDWILQHGSLKRGDVYFPNYADGGYSSPIQEGDLPIPANVKFLSANDIMIDMRTSHLVTDFEVAFFDKSDLTLWDDEVRSSKYYYSSTPFLWHASELMQEFIYNHALNKYKLWSKISEGVFDDIFLYSELANLTSDQICKLKKYVNLGEEISTPEEDYTLCDIDKLIE